MQNVAVLNELDRMQAYINARRAELTEPEPLPGIAIADRAALDAALAGAKGGEVFRLAAGDYGDLTVKPNFADAVTLISTDGADFGAVSIERYHWQKRGRGFVLDGIRSKWIAASYCDNIKILRCQAEQIQLDGVDGFEVRRNWIHDGHFPLRLLRTANGTVHGNVMERAREDTMRISGDSHHIDVRGNVFLDNRACKPIHGDHLQIFGLPKETVCPQHITVEQNLQHDNATGKEVFHIRDGKDGAYSWKLATKGKPHRRRACSLVTASASSITSRCGTT